MTTRYYSNAIRTQINISSPTTGVTVPNITATLQNGTSDIAISIQLAISDDPIASVIDWLANRDILVTAVLYNDNVWYLATEYDGDLT